MNVHSAMARLMSSENTQGLDLSMLVRIVQ
jgi:hypothetical protein